MKKIAFVLVLVCIMTIFAQNTYEIIYGTENGLEILRIMEITSEDKIDLIRDVQVEAFTTNLSILIKNNEIPKSSVEIKERLDYLPENIDYTIYPETEEKEGRLKWEFTNLKANEEIKMTISFKGKYELEKFENLGKPYVETHFKNASLIIPSIGRIGDEMLITAITEDNEALPYITISVLTPSEKEVEITTDERGVARITPQENGIYSFKFIDFGEEEYSVEVAKIITQDLTTASISDGDLNAGDLIPLVVGLIAIALVIFGAVLYIAPRNNTDPKPEDWANAFSTEDDKEPGWMKKNNFFSERTIENESSNPKKVSIKSSLIINQTTKPNTDTVKDIKAKTKKIIENRKKLSKKTKSKTKNISTKAKKTTKKLKGAKKTNIKKTASKKPNTKKSTKKTSSKKGKKTTRKRKK